MDDRTAPDHQARRPIAPQPSRRPQLEWPATRRSRNASAGRNAVQNLIEAIRDCSRLVSHGVSHSRIRVTDILNLVRARNALGGRTRISGSRHTATVEWLLCFRNPLISACAYAFVCEQLKRSVEFQMNPLF